VAETYVDRITLRLRAYSDYPLPEKFVEGWSLDVDVVGPVDREELLQEIKAILSGKPFVLDETLSEMSWGAAGASLNIVIGVSKAITTAAGLVYLWNELQRRVERRGRRPHGLDVDAVNAYARDWLAWFLAVDPAEVRSHSVDQAGRDAYRASFVTPRGDFSLEIDNDGVQHVEQHLAGGAAAQEGS